jgi:hypothetical protein
VCSAKHGRTFNDSTCSQSQSRNSWVWRWFMIQPRLFIRTRALASACRSFWPRQGNPSLRAPQGRGNPAPALQGTKALHRKPYGLPRAFGPRNDGERSARVLMENLGSSIKNGFCLEATSARSYKNKSAGAKPLPCSGALWP